MELTTKELTGIGEQLNLELTLIKKYTMYSAICQDHQLKSKFEQVASEHQNHYNRLLSQLN